MIHILFAALLLSSAADESTPSRELYDSLVQCAAFHNVEAGMTRDGGDSAASHLATANDYRADARKQVPGGTTETADRDVDAVTVHYREILAKGDPADMAKSWTALESACRALHAAKAKLAAPRNTSNSR